MDDDRIRALARFDSATIANAIERFGVRDRLEGYSSLELQCQFPELPPIVGYAVTCTAESTFDADDTATGWGALLDVIVAAPKPAILTIGWRGTDGSRGCVVGDMVATGLSRIGVVGIVTDTGIRDRSGMRRSAPTMQVFARGTVVSHGRIHLMGIGKPVGIGGLRVEHGALLHGDENGIVEIPLGIADRVPEVAGQVRAEEQDYFAAMSAQDAGFAEVRGWLAPHG